MSLKKATFIIVLILLVDQISKFYIKTNFVHGENIVVFSWFQILFIENKGMAWGAKLNDVLPFLSDRTAKLILTSIRLIAIIGIAFWLINTIRKHNTKILVISISLIFAGALGNIIDSVFYSILFSDSYGQVATFLPNDGGYDSLLHGKVVDMLYFPMWKGYLPEWLPFMGGEYFTFFNAVFNIADMAISTGVGLLLVFNKKAFPKTEE